MIFTNRYLKNIMQFDFNLSLFNLSFLVYGLFTTTKAAVKSSIFCAFDEAHEQ